MTRLAQKENGIGLALNEKASRDTDVLKTLTLMALVYLPASFVSVSPRRVAALSAFESMLTPAAVYDGYGLHRNGKERGPFFHSLPGRVLDLPCLDGGPIDDNTLRVLLVVTEPAA